ncbi:hypothetical protein ElyMa_005881700 [Elysia marginata]|uniref:Uncharacterized protein n=1 Tax=Elysia marginata TaxID=1093978 RepID=A0AAV4G3V0_9GAST|nr:hypothetical protein ElyMa_005881700 [Elysia marginata]
MQICKKSVSSSMGLAKLTCTPGTATSTIYRLQTCPSKLHVLQTCHSEGGDLPRSPGASLSKHGFALAQSAHNKRIRQGRAGHPTDQGYNLTRASMPKHWTSGVLASASISRSQLAHTAPTVKRLVSVTKPLEISCE